MFSGLLYVIALLSCGILLGGLFAPLCRSRSDVGLARAYYGTMAGLLSLSFCISVWSILGHPPTFTTIIAKVVGALLLASFTAIFGIAFRRASPLALLTKPPVIDAMRMTVALTFAIAGIGKAFNMAFMTAFFTQSGYSATFLKFIMLAE